MVLLFFNDLSKTKCSKSDKMYLLADKMYLLADKMYLQLYKMTSHVINCLKSTFLKVKFFYFFHKSKMRGYMYDYETFMTKTLIEI